MSRPPQQRTRPYDRSEPAQLGDVLSQLFALRGYGRSQANQQLEEIWKQVAGEEIAAQTKVANLKNGVLHIGVSNSALMSEIVAFHKVEFVRRIKSEHRQLKVRDIKFKLRGDLND